MSVTDPLHFENKSFISSTNSVDFNWDVVLFDNRSSNETWSPDLGPKKELWREIPLGVVLTLLCLVTTIGNAMVLHAVRTERRLQTVCIEWDLQIPN
ncbi:hypothetical protein DPMN_121780 [Dreissena polymorpha]|uniref:Uncharacterized protein n=1 Tax=Dreissena polymorpha TaxID=45954 RepID=A0A9D4GM92_DREPO|nr:hypothetical protein DPMN_121780 [Dreissena polymorpha]